MDEINVKCITDNVHLIHCSEVDTLQHAIQYSLPALVERLQKPISETVTVAKPVRLIVVDSIAAPFRGVEAQDLAPRQNDASERPDSKDTTNSGSSAKRHIFAERTKDLTCIASGLLRLTQQHHIAVVIVNQVSDVFTRHTYQYARENADPAEGHDTASVPTEADRTGLPVDYRHYGYASRFFSGEAAGAHHRARAEARKMAVFGLSWTNSINARIMLSRTGRRKRRVDGVELSEQQVLEQEHLEDQAAMHATANDTAEDRPPGTLVHSHTEEVRRADVVFSPFCELGRIDYVFRESGLVSVGKYIQEERLPKGIKLSRRKRKRQQGESEDELTTNGMLSQASDSSSMSAAEDPGQPEIQTAEYGHRSNGYLPSSAMASLAGGMLHSGDNDNEASLWDNFDSDDTMYDEMQMRDSEGLTQVVPETQTG